MKTGTLGAHFFAARGSNEAAGVHCTDWGCGSLVSGRTCSALGRDRAHRGFDGLPQNDPEGQARIAAFRQGLQDLKWTEGSNIRIDIRWGTGDAAAVGGAAWGAAR